MDKEEKEIIKTIVVKEQNENPYRLKGELQFEVLFDNGKPKIHGILETETLISKTEIDSIETWRYSLKSVDIISMTCKSKITTIVYNFVADDFEVKA